MKRLFGAALRLIIIASAGFGIGLLLCRSPVAKPLLARLPGGPPANPALENLRKAATGEQISETTIDREFDLLRHQFADEKEFQKALESSGVSATALRRELADHLRARQWIEKTISLELAVTETESRALYLSAPESFALPERFRVNHIFLAAPLGTAREVLSAKRTLIQGLVIRILGGEQFDALAAEASEDEETRDRGGDLGYFSAFRMPPEFSAEVEKLRVGELSAPVQSHLGFHVVQMTDRRPPAQLAFDEAKAEIATALQNKRREAAVTQLAGRLNMAEFGRALH